MVFLEKFAIAVAFALCAVAVKLVSAPAWADGGGAGIQFQIQYDENADEDEYDEQPESATSSPLGFSSEIGLRYELSAKLKIDVAYTPTPETDEAQTWSGVTLDGPSLSEDKITYFSPRFNARFPGISYTPAEPGTAVDVGEPIAPSATFEIKPRFEHWTRLWVGETAVDKVAEDPSPRVGYSLSYGAKDDLRLNATYTMWKDETETEQPQPGAQQTGTQQTGTQQASTGSTNLAESIKSMSRVQAMQTIFGVSEEKAEEFVEGMSRFIQNERARNYLGNDTYRKLQEQFGSAPGSAGSGLQSYTLDSAADHSDWSGVYLYCGGSCVYGF